MSTTTLLRCDDDTCDDFVEVAADGRSWGRLSAEDEHGWSCDDERGDLCPNHA